MHINVTAVFKILLRESVSALNVTPLVEQPIISFRSDTFLMPIIFVNRKSLLLQEISVALSLTDIGRIKVSK